MKKVTILVLSLILVLSFSSLVDASKSFKLAHDHVVGSMPDISANLFAQLVEELSNGELKVNTYPAGQLGNGSSIIEGVMQNSIDITFVGGGWYVNFEKDYMATSFPFTFDDKDHFLKFLNSEKHDEMMERLEKERGLKYLAYHAIRLPRVVLSKTPIFGPEDIKGKKMRVPAQKNVNEGWKGIGANTLRVDWGEVYLAGKQGLMEITVGPFDSLYDAKFHEVFPYITWTQHCYTLMPFTISKKRWDSLNGEEQGILKEAAEKASDHFNKLSEEFSETYREKMMEEGVAFIHVDTTPFIKELAGVPEKLEAEGLWEKGLYEYIRSLAE